MMRIRSLIIKTMITAFRRKSRLLTVYALNFPGESSGC